MNKLEALRYFCSAAETLNFRETAQRLAVSPQVVTRMIADLEALLGESMFKRNTRNIKLTEFGEQFLPKAIQYLAEGERLFSINNVKDKAMQGIVRTTLPPMPYNDEILFELLTALDPYPDITINWRGALTSSKVWMTRSILACEFVKNPSWIGWRSIFALFRKKLLLRQLCSSD